MVSLVYIAALAHKASLDQTRILAAVQRPIALKCIQEKVPAPAWKTKPTWYLIAEEDRMMSSKTQRFMADRMRANIWSHNVDHTPMLTTPHFVVDVIMEAATQTLRDKCLCVKDAALLSAGKAACTALRKHLITGRTQ